MGGGGGAYLVQLCITDSVYVIECRIHYSHHKLVLFGTLNESNITQAGQHNTSQSLMPGKDNVETHHNNNHTAV